MNKRRYIDHIFLYDIEYESYVGERLTLDKKVARKQEQDRRAGVREMIEDAQEDQEDEQDIERWENELIRHGGVRPQRREEKARDPYAPPPDYRPAEGKRNFFFLF